jgi:hypothetical protein
LLWLERLLTGTDFNHLQETVKSWVSALLQLVELLPTHPATAPLLKAAAADAAPAGAAPAVQRRQGLDAEEPRPGAEGQQLEEGKGASGQEGRADSEAAAAAAAAAAGPGAAGAKEGAVAEGQQQQQQQQGGTLPRPLRAHSSEGRLRDPQMPAQRLASTHWLVPAVVMAVALGGLVWGRWADEWRRLPGRRLSGQHSGA